MKKGINAERRRRAISCTYLSSVWSRVPSRNNSVCRLIPRASVACLLYLTGYMVTAIGCRQHGRPGPGSQSGPGHGPEQYTARIVRTAERDGAQETLEYRIAVSGQMIREDWVENGEQRALIVRPDVGEAYQLFPDRGEYLVETVGGGALLATGSPATGNPATGNRTSATQASSGKSLSKQEGSDVLVDPIAIESDLSPATTTADNITELALPDAKVDGHPCRVTERRAVTSDGTTEIVRTYKATDLEGLSIKTESESEGKNGRVRVVTETQDIQRGVPQSAFDVPSGFRRKPA